MTSGENGGRAVCLGKGPDDNVPGHCEKSWGKIDGDNFLQDAHQHLYTTRLYQERQ
jgi:hypothetical protein